MLVVVVDFNIGCLYVVNKGVCNVVIDGDVVVFDVVFGYLVCS